MRCISMALAAAQQSAYQQWQSSYRLSIISSASSAAAWLCLRRLSRLAASDKCSSRHRLSRQRRKCHSSSAYLAYPQASYPSTCHHPISASLSVSRGYLSAAAASIHLIGNNKAVEIRWRMWRHQQYHQCGSSYQQLAYQQHLIASAIGIWRQ